MTGENMILDNIGIHTINTERACRIANNNPYTLWERGEILITDRCNYKCIYCKGVKNKFRGELSFCEVKTIVDLFEKGGIKTTRLTGGEPTVYPHLLEVVRYIKTKHCIEKIGISTNGSAPLSYYLTLIQNGVNEIGISLDADNVKMENIMAGTKTPFKRVINNIKELAKLIYLTAGVVLNKKNIENKEKIIEYIISLGVKDMYIVPDTSFKEPFVIDINTELPILNYRINNLKNEKRIRGLTDTDSKTCHLVKDDITICKSYHFPCIVYLREGGKPIGTVSDYQTMRTERYSWSNNTDTHKDSICLNNCRDFCVDYNNQVDNRI